MQTEITILTASSAMTSRKLVLPSMRITIRLRERTLSTRQEREEHGRTSRTTLSMMMFFGQRLQRQAVAALEWELASVGFRRRLVFVPLGVGVAWTSAVLAAFLAVTRSLVRLTLAGTALSEHLVVRVKNGVNAKQRGSQPLLCYLQII